MERRAISLHNGAYARMVVDEGAWKIGDTVRKARAGAWHEENVAFGQLDD